MVEQPRNSDASVGQTRPILKPHPEDMPFLRKLAWTIALAVVLLIVWRAAHLLLLAFGSVLGAVMFRSAADLLRKLGIRSSALSLGLGMLLVLAVIGLIFWLLGAQFGSEIGAMLGDLPATIDKVGGELRQTPVGNAVVEAARSATGGGTIANRLADLTQGAGEVLLNFAIVIVGAMFLAASPNTYLAGVVLLTPPPARPAMQHALDQMSIALRLWLKAKLISMVIMTVLIGGCLWMAGLKSWAALGLLGGLSEFVPYIGPTVAMLPAIGIAAAQGGDLLWRTIAAYAVVRLVEAYALTPWVNNSVVNIPPALTLFVILGAGAVFGAYGVFFAGALLVVGYVAVRELYLRDTLGEDIQGVPDKAAPARD